VATTHRGPAVGREVDEVLAHHHVPTRPAGWIGWDPKAADLVRGGGAAAVRRSTLLRTARGVVERLAAEQYSVSEQRTARARLATAQFSDAASQWRGMGRAQAMPHLPNPVNGHESGVRSHG
jgi:hypothetical protein